MVAVAHCSSFYEGPAVADDPVARRRLRVRRRPAPWGSARRGPRRRGAGAGGPRGRYSERSWTAIAIEYVPYFGIACKSPASHIVGATLQRIPIIIRQDVRLGKILLDRFERCLCFLLRHHRPRCNALKQFLQFLAHI